MIDPDRAAEISSGQISRGSDEGPNGPRKGLMGVVSKRRNSMSDKRQKNQLVLAFPEESRSEAPKASAEGTESLAAKRRI